MEITFNIANICNLKCSYCIFVGKGSGKEISGEILHGLNRLLEYYTFQKNERTSLTFSGGGEPFLFFKDIKKILEGIDIKNRNLLDIYIITNGTIYSKEISEVVRKYNIFLVLSLDGGKESHDVNRVLENGEPSFDMIMKNSELLFEDVRDVNYTIYSNNFYKLKEGVEFTQKHFQKLRRLNFNFVFNSDVWSDNLLIHLKEHFDEFIQEYISKQMYKRFETNLRNFAYAHSQESEESCLGHLYINRDGNIFKCGAYEYNFAGEPLGNLYQTGGTEVDFLRENTKNCASKCQQSEYDVQNKKLTLILFYIGKRYQVIDKYIDNSLRKYNY